MAITGCLSEFSLPELFQFLEQGNKTGLLSLVSKDNSSSHHHQNYYIWLKEGRILAAANRLDGLGLISLIEERGWLSKMKASEMAQICSPTAPMGLCLKSQNLLDAEQLKVLFYVQVTRQVCNLFQLTDADFNFDSTANLPVGEMTGLSTPSTEVTLAGLRALRDWSALAEKLPEGYSTLLSTIEGEPTITLNRSELKVWNFTNGRTTINNIAKELDLSVQQVKQIAFRLIVLGLVEETSPLAASPKDLYLLESEALEFELNAVESLESELAAVIEEKQLSNAVSTESSNHNNQLSQSFLDSLASFLQSQS